MRRAETRRRAARLAALALCCGAAAANTANTAGAANAAANAAAGAAPADALAGAPTANTAAGMAVAGAPTANTANTANKTNTTKSPVSDGMHHVKSRHNIADTVERAKRMLEHQGFRVFGVIDHADNARTVGLELPPTKLLVFGNPEGGTPLMRANRLIAIDLPLKLLVWEDAAGVVWISYSDAAFLQKRHRLDGQKQAFGKMARLLEDLGRASATR